MKLKKIYKNLKYKYRLVIYNETTFETEYSFYLSQLNVILALCTLLLLGMLLSLAVVTYTPLKYYMPGFGEVGVRKQLRELVAETESLKRKAKENDLWAENIKQVLSGKLPASKINTDETMPVDSSNSKSESIK
jgi:hypothetical protein